MSNERWKAIFRAATKITILAIVCLIPAGAFANILEDMIFGIFGSRQQVLMACDATISKNGESSSRCERNILSKKNLEAAVMAAHETRFASLAGAEGVERCFRDRDKNRMQEQILTVCEFSKGTTLKIFVTTAGRDSRKNIFLKGAQIKWYEHDIALYLYRRFFREAASYENWLLPEKSR